MATERGETSANNGARVVKGGRFLGSLKDALMAAGRDDAQGASVIVTPPDPKAVAAVSAQPMIQLAPPIQVVVAPSPSAEEAARAARTMPAPKTAERQPDRPERQDRHIEFNAPPTTRVVRRDASEKVEPEQIIQDKADRTVLVRGRQKIARQNFAQDPVVGFLVVVGGPGLGAHRPVYEGNNTVGRDASNRIPLDFGDETISHAEQAYIRYDSADRSFLFVPNLAKTNVVSVNDKRPAGAVTLKPMDVITLGRTQVAFLPFCGQDFDWSEISETKD